MNRRTALMALALAVILNVSHSGIVILGGEISLQALPPLTDDGCQSACGPISCFVAARSMGVNASLSDLIHKCRWHSGKLTKLQDMQRTLASFPNEIDCLPVRLSVESLKEHLKNSASVVVLPVRKKSHQVNHAFCVVGFEDGKFQAFDYPELLVTYSESELADIWDGPALVVSRSLRGWILMNWFWLALPSAVALLLIGGSIGRALHRRSPQSSPAARVFTSTTLICMAGFVLSLAGCDSSGLSKTEVEDDGQKNAVFTGGDTAVTEESTAVLRHDFGVAEADEYVEHVFEIPNWSEKEIRFLNAYVDCGCLSIVEKPKSILPHQVGLVKLRLDTRGLRGGVSRRASFESDDATAPPILLMLTGIVASIWASPSTVDLGELKAGVPASRMVQIEAAGFPNAKITSAIPQDPSIRVTSESVLAAEEARALGMNPFCRARIQWNGTSLPSGTFQTDVTFTTNIPQFPKLNVSVMGYAKGSSETNPSRLYFGNVTPGTTTRKACTLVNAKWEMATLQSLEKKASHEFVQGDFSHELIAKKEVLKLVVALNIPKTASKGLIQGDFVVSQKSGEVVLAVPYTALVR